MLFRVYALHSARESLSKTVSTRYFKKQYSTLWLSETAATSELIDWLCFLGGKIKPLQYTEFV